jgi:hypothetical protein
VTSPAPTGPPAPVVRSCHDVIQAAAGVTQAITQSPMLAQIRHYHPDVADKLLRLTDAVLDLDFHTNLLGGPPAPAPTGMPSGPLRGVY